MWYVLFLVHIVYQLSLWRPSSDVESLLKEGGRYKVYNLATAEGKKRSSHETVQLTGTKKTQFQVLQVPKQTSSFLHSWNSIIEDKYIINI